MRIKHINWNPAAYDDGSYVHLWYELEVALEGEEEKRPFVQISSTITGKTDSFRLSDQDIENMRFTKRRFLERDKFPEVSLC